MGAKGMIYVIKKDGYADFNFGNAYNGRSGKCFG